MSNDNKNAAISGAQARPRCDYTGRLCLDPTQVCRCYTCQNFAIAQFFSSPSASQASKPSCHICGEGMDKGFICGKCGAHTGVAQAAPAGLEEVAREVVNALIAVIYQVKPLPSAIEFLTETAAAILARHFSGGKGAECSAIKNMSEHPRLVEVYRHLRDGEPFYACGVIFDIIAALSGSAQEPGSDKGR